MAEARAAHPDVTLVGVMGSPIAHSLSPLLHYAAFVGLKVDWQSAAFEVPRGYAWAEQALADMRHFDIRGLSVTMPHKANVATLVDRCSDRAARLGAVNCVTNRDGLLQGDNTDGAGFVASLARGASFDPTGARCVVVGAGGAARAVILALADAGASEVAVVNRTPARAGEAAALAGPVGRVVTNESREADIAQADLVVNATPVGMVGDGSRSGESDWVVEPALLHEGQVAADLIYVPRPTAWLAAAEASGAVTVDGLGMLVHQAALQLEIWTGAKAPVDVMWRAVNP